MTSWWYSCVVRLFGVTSKPRSQGDVSSVSDSAGQFFLEVWEALMWIGAIGTDVRTYMFCLFLSTCPMGTASGRFPSLLLLLTLAPEMISCTMHEYMLSKYLLKDGLKRKQEQLNG